VKAPNALVIVNESVYSIFKRNLDMPCCEYDHSNCLIARIFSCYLQLALRFNRAFNVDCNEFQNNTVLFPLAGLFVRPLNQFFRRSKILYKPQFEDAEQFPDAKSSSRKQKNPVTNRCVAQICENCRRRKAKSLFIKPVIEPKPMPQQLQK
jgi:hypothetical protein